MPKGVTQSRKWSLVTYLRPDLIADVFAEKVEQVRAYAYCTHNKDEGKVSHTHIVVWLNSSYSAASIKNWFRGVDINDELANTLAQPCKDLPSAYRYLTHKDNPDKYQYSDSDVICSHPSLFDESEQIDDTYSAVQDLLDGVPLADVAKRYGRDFIFHYSHIRQLVVDIKSGM